MANEPQNPPVAAGPVAAPGATTTPTTSKTVAGTGAGEPTTTPVAGPHDAANVRSQDQLAAELPPNKRADLLKETTAEQDKQAARERAEANTALVNRPVVIHGKPGHPFNIDAVGGGFGAQEGQLLVSGRAVPISRWVDHSIKGILPGDIKPGPVELTLSSGAQLKGEYPPKPEHVRANQFRPGMTTPTEVTVKMADGTLVRGVVVEDVKK